METSKVTATFKHFHYQLDILPTQSQTGIVPTILQLNSQILKLIGLLPDTPTNRQTKKEATQLLVQNLLLTSQGTDSSLAQRQLPDIIIAMQVALEIILDGEEAI